MPKAKVKIKNNNKKTAASRFVTDEFPIPTGKMTQWAPQHIVWAKASILPKGSGLDLTFGHDSWVYRMSYLRRINTNIDLTNIVTFAKAVRDAPSTLPAPETDTRLAFEIDQNNLSQFSIRGDCYVVISLVSENWQFASTSQGLAAINETMKQKYAQLFQLPAMPGSNPIAGSQPAGDGCRVIYFSARLQGLNYQEINQFTTYAEAGRGRKMLLARLDPDIKNDGTNPQWPP